MRGAFRYQLDGMDTRRADGQHGVVLLVRQRGRFAVPQVMLRVPLSSALYRGTQSGSLSEGTPRRSLHCNNHLTRILSISTRYTIARYSTEHVSLCPFVHGVKVLSSGIGLI